MVIWVTFFINIGFFNIFLVLGGAIELLGDLDFVDVWVWFFFVLGFFLGFFWAMGLGDFGFCGRKLYISI
nr:MAG TPA: hypothetical protein [Caudoviricetes sp.]